MNIVTLINDAGYISQVMNVFKIYYKWLGLRGFFFFFLMVWLGLSLTKKIKAFRSDKVENMPQKSSSLICRSHKVENMPQRSFSLIYLITELNHKQHVLIIVFSFISEPVSVLPLNRNVLVKCQRKYIHI